MLGLSPSAQTNFAGIARVIDQSDATDNTAAAGAPETSPIPLAPVALGLYKKCSDSA